MNKIPVTFLAGHSPRKGVIGIPAKPIGDRDTEYLSKMFTFDGAAWGVVQKEFDFAPKAISYLTSDGGNYKAWWLVGRNGETIEVRKGVPAFGQIPGAGTRNVAPIYGYIENIKCIDNELYACGGGRQVYRLEGGKWRSLSDEILTEKRGFGFFDIDGTSSTDLYAVGFKGEIWHFDGSWRLDDAPTSNILTSVRAVGAQDVWVCGNNRTLLHGSFNQWDSIVSAGSDRNFYCVERFMDKTYVAANRSLAVVAGDEVVPVDMKLGKAVSTHRLHGRDGLLWSIGEEDLVRFDGVRWLEFVHPDNA